MKREEYKKRVREIYADMEAECPEGLPGFAHAQATRQHQVGADGKIQCVLVEKRTFHTPAQLRAWEQHTQLLVDLGGGPDGVELED